MTRNDYQRQQRAHGREIREAIDQRFAAATCSIPSCRGRVTYLEDELALCAGHAQMATERRATMVPAAAARRREAEALRRRVLGA